MAPKLPTGSFSQLPLPAKVFLLVVLLVLITSVYFVGFHMGLLR